MTGILASGSNAKAPTAIGSLQFQTSQVGGVMPFVYGTTRVACNLLDYKDFTAKRISGKSGGKGKGGADAKGNGQFTYTASFIMGICQGPVTGYGLCWFEQNVQPLSGVVGISHIALGGLNQSADPYWITNHSGDAIGYSGTGFFTADNYNLGYTAALPNFSVEVIMTDSTDAGATGVPTFASVNQDDANPGYAIVDFLTNPIYGVGLPNSFIDDGPGGSLSQSQADNGYAAYCDAAGLWLSPQLDQQTQAQQAIESMTQLTNSAIVWSGGLLKIIPFGDAPINASYWIVRLHGGSTSAGDIFTLSIGNAETGLLFVQYQAQPANFNTDTVDPSSPMGQLAHNVMGTPNLVAAGITAGCGRGSLIIRAAGADQNLTIGIAATGSETFTISGPIVRDWTPNTTVQYALNDSNFIVQQSYAGIHMAVTPGSPALRQGSGPVTGRFFHDPVTITRSSPADAMNYVALEVLDRSYGYVTQIVEVFDQASVDLYGVRKDTSVKARAICDPTLCGQTVAQLILQRNIAYRNTYTFSLGWGFCRLEPMDLVSLTDPYLGLNNQIVRITSVAEDQEGTLTFTAEDWLGNNGAPGTIPSISKNMQVSAPTTTNLTHGFTPQSVSTPFFVEPTARLLANQGFSEPRVIIGLGSVDPTWGGCAVYVSIDNASFSHQGNFFGPSTLGVLAAPFRITDTTVMVDLTASQGTLASVSPLASANSLTLCAVGNNAVHELIAYTTATLVSGFVYQLSGLYRGLYGTPFTGHNMGASFLALHTGQYFEKVLPPRFAGRNLFFKFPSFNFLGNGSESLANVPSYPYTATGAGNALIAAGNLGGNPTAIYYVTSSSPMAVEGLNLYNFNRNVSPIEHQ